MYEEKVLMDLGDIRQYKIRLVETKKGKVLDIREHIENDEYTGFTKKGIRLHTDDVNTLFAKLVAAKLITVEE